jgi:hypothetical protein
MLGGDLEVAMNDELVEANIIAGRQLGMRRPPHGAAATGERQSE